ncbi:MAG: FAD-dependent thymidylate synthase [Anaerovoracaceae bacterium]
MTKIIPCKQGMKVRLIGSMPRESYMDMAASIIHSEKDIDDIVAMPYNSELVRKVLDMGHLAIAEFDYFIFAVEGVSRVLETQLVRKRHASFSIKSGRKEKGGKRVYSVVKPSSLDGFKTNVSISKATNVKIEGAMFAMSDISFDIDFETICEILSQYYDNGVAAGLPEEDLRYTKPQGTEAKIMLAMNAHALLDIFKIRCCKNAQDEISYLFKQILIECKKRSPELFKKAGASCVVLGYCPENKAQHKDCVGKIPTHNDVVGMIANWRNNNK